MVVSKRSGKYRLVMAVAALLLLRLSVMAAAPVALSALSVKEAVQVCEVDQQRIGQWRDGLGRVLEFVSSRSDLFASAADSLSGRQQQEIGNTWACFMDYFLALESLGRYHANFFELKDEALRQQSFLAAYAVFLVQYRFSKELMQQLNGNAEVTALFNASQAELGLPHGMYDQLNLRFAAPARKQEFAALNAILHTTKSKESNALILSAIRDDASRIWNLTHGSSRLLSGKDAQKYVREQGVTQWWPVPAGLSRWAGAGLEAGAISGSQVQDCLNMLQPGDLVFIQRRHSLGQTGIIGFWQHVALYIGTPGQREAFFADATTQQWVQQSGEPSGRFEALLAQKCPVALQRNAVASDKDGAPVLLFPLDNGVSLLSVTSFLRSDCLAVLRPRLAPAHIAAALLRAMHYYGRPYDSHFDFMTDTALTCSELVVKAFQPQSSAAGLNLPRQQLIGHLICSPTDLVRHVDATLGTATQQLDFVLFLDSYPKGEVASRASEAQFRTSWQRPKWQVNLQKIIAQRAEAVTTGR